jgi:uncharacterized protein YaiL (DUF2058 family)
MGLFDELKKSGFVDKKAAKQIAHQQRVERKEKGVEGVEAERAAREAELKKLQEEERQRQKRRADEERKAQLERERRLSIASLIASQALNEGFRGPRSFFFEARSGRVPFLTLDLEVARRLESGNLAIVEDPSTSYESFRLVPREVAKRVHELDPELVRFAVGRFT